MAEHFGGISFGNKWMFFRLVEMRLCDGTFWDFGGNDRCATFDYSVNYVWMQNILI